MDSYDKWKTTDPDQRDSKCTCSQCGEMLYEGNEYWELEDEIYCEDCAEEWLSLHKNWVSERMANGE